MIPSNGNKRLLTTFHRDRISRVIQTVAHGATIGTAVGLVVLRYGWAAISVAASSSRRWMGRHASSIAVGAAVFVLLTLAVLWTIDRLAQGDERRIEERAWAIHRRNTPCPAATASQQENTEWVVSRRECLPAVGLGLRRDRASR